MLKSSSSEIQNPKASLPPYADAAQVYPSPDVGSLGYKFMLSQVA